MVQASAPFGSHPQFTMPVPSPQVALAKTGIKIIDKKPNKKIDKNIFFMNSYVPPAGLEPTTLRPKRSTISISPRGHEVLLF